MIEMRLHDRIGAIAEAEWDALVGPGGPPFLAWAWLDALEKAGCVSEESGWLPQHITLHEDGVLVAAAPAYVKSNSQGEFVFDFSWADFAHRLGIPYYPKLIVAVPFTPATGARLLVREAKDRDRLVAAAAQGLAQIVQAGEISSAHVLFPPEDETTAWTRAGMVPRMGVQFQWHNPGYVTFDDFLATFSSKRRNQIKREVRETEKQGVTITTLSGSDITDGVLEAMYRFYLATVQNFSWGRQYLNRAFFDDVCTRLSGRVEIVLAREASGRAIAGAFNLASETVLYGRYWGADRELPFLHFSVCYYHSIAECIAKKRVRFEPGAGGEHKLARGFDPTITHSAHLLADPRLDRAVRSYLARERMIVGEQVAEARAEVARRRPAL